jgi:hypothetical protein
MRNSHDHHSFPSPRPAAEATKQAVLVHENIDIHDRASRLWIRAWPSQYGLINIQFTATFSGLSRPDLHRVVWQTHLPPESVGVIREELLAAIEQSVWEGQP